MDDKQFWQRHCQPTVTELVRKGEMDMELKLSEQEVKDAIIKAGNSRIIGFTFNAVEFDCGYSTVRGATLRYDEPEKVEPTPEPKADPA